MNSCNYPNRANALNFHKIKHLYKIIIARETHAGAYTHAGPEIGVASTKAFTTLIIPSSLFMVVPAKWVKRGRQNTLKIFTHKKYHLLL